MPSRRNKLGRQIWHGEPVTGAQRVPGPIGHDQGSPISIARISAVIAPLVLYQASAAAAQFLHRASRERSSSNNSISFCSEASLLKTPQGRCGLYLRMYAGVVRKLEHQWQVRRVAHQAQAVCAAKARTLQSIVPRGLAGGIKHVQAAVRSQRPDAGEFPDTLQGGLPHGRVSMPEPAPAGNPSRPRQSRGRSYRTW